MSERLLTHVDFRDKILKLIGSLAKTRAVAAVGDPQKSKELLNLARESSRVRKWLKFLRILRTIRSVPKQFALDTDPLTRAEAAADVLQMVTEDLATLQSSGFWSGILGAQKIPGLADFEDKTWFIWAGLALVVSIREWKAAWQEYGVAAAKEGTEDEEKFPKTAAEKRLIAASVACLKFLCELGDSGIAVAPAGWKKGREGSLIVVSAALGSISALCSLHKFLKN